MKTCTKVALFASVILSVNVSTSLAQTNDDNEVVTLDKFVVVSPRLPPIIVPIQIMVPSWTPVGPTTPSITGGGQGGHGAFNGDKLSATGIPCWKIKEAALMAQKANQFDQSGNPPTQVGNNVPVSADDLAPQLVNMTPSVLQSTLNDAHALVFRDTSTNVYTIAYAGTNPASMPAWYVDVANNVDIPTSRYNSGMELAWQLQNAFGASNVQVVGQSMGGGISASAAAVTGVNAITFNAAGANQAVVSNFMPGASLDASVNNITNINVIGQALQLVQQTGVALPPAGRTFNISPDYSFYIPTNVANMLIATGNASAMAYLSVQLHGIDAILKALGC